MENLINKIFSECSFKKIASKGTAVFFAAETGDCPEYYIVDFLEMAHLRSFAENGHYDVMELFEEQKKADKEIGKNTSLILCAKANDLKNEYDNHKNSILLIEENQYFFKRYVIAYTEQSVAAISDAELIVAKLQKDIVSNAAFQQYKEEPFRSEDYFLLMQLFLKIPFLNVPEPNATDYRPLEDLIGSKLSERQVQLRKAINENDIIHSVESWEQLRNAAVDVNSESAVLQELFKIINDHA